MPWRFPRLKGFQKCCLSNYNSYCRNFFQLFQKFHDCFQFLKTFGCRGGFPDSKVFKSFCLSIYNSYCTKFFQTFQKFHGCFQFLKTFGCRGGFPDSKVFKSVVYQFITPIAENFFRHFKSFKAVSNFRLSISGGKNILVQFHKKRFSSQSRTCSIELRFYVGVS